MPSTSARVLAPVVAILLASTPVAAQHPTPPAPAAPAGGHGKPQAPAAPAAGRTRQASGPTGGGTRRSRRGARTDDSSAGTRARAGRHAVACCQASRGATSETKTGHAAPADSPAYPAAARRRARHSDGHRETRDLARHPTGEPTSAVRTEIHAARRAHLAGRHYSGRRSSDVGRAVASDAYLGQVYRRPKQS